MRSGSRCSPTRNPVRHGIRSPCRPIAGRWSRPISPLCSAPDVFRRISQVDDGTAGAMKFGIGQPVRRFEDVRLITGRGRYQDDIVLPRQAYAVFLRSPHAHARIVSIDVEAARAAPGVLAVYTGADYKADGLSMPKAAMPRKKRDGSPMFAPQRPALVVDRARYVGDPVAMVIAETLAQAKDAAELVEVDYEPLPSA